MSRYTPIDRFTLPKDIPDDIPDHLPEDFPGSVPGEIPSPTHACWSRPGGDDPANPVTPHTHTPAEEAARGYAMRSAAGRGWAAGEEPPGEVVMVQGLPCTAEDLRLREPGEGGAQSHARPQSRSGPAPLLTPAKQAAFCTALAEHGNVRLACRAVSVSPQTAYRARRAFRAFRACWDAALILARDHAEQVLADRALNGVQEAVFYHGEEVATRTRYDSRLLLAHLARLDKRVEERETCDDCHAPLLGEDDFDEAIEALGSAQDGGEGDAAIFAPGQCSMCSTFPEMEAASSAQVPPVEPLADRLAAMQAALPEGAQAQSGMTDREWRWAEPERLCAFEAGEEDWWLVRGEDAGAMAGGAADQGAR